MAAVSSWLTPELLDDLRRSDPARSTNVTLPRRVGAVAPALRLPAAPPPPPALFSGVLSMWTVSSECDLLESALSRCDATCRLWLPKRTTLSASTTVRHGTLVWAGTLKPRPFSHRTGSATGATSSSAAGVVLVATSSRRRS